LNIGKGQEYLIAVQFRVTSFSSQSTNKISQVVIVSSIFKAIQFTLIAVFSKSETTQNIK
jgi:hypothetical protein